MNILNVKFGNKLIIYSNCGGGGVAEIGSNWIAPTFWEKWGHLCFLFSQITVSQLRNC